MMLRFYTRTKMKFLLHASCLFLFVSCTTSYSEGNLSDLPITKQRQRVTLLQKKLQMAEKEQKKIETEVEWLNEELALAKLTLISKLVDEFEVGVRQNPKKWNGAQTGHLFLKERESLYELIQTSSYSFEAQMVLDKILQLITELSELSKEAQAN